MPLPLIIAGAIGVGLYGAVKTVGAAMDNSDADALNSSAHSKVREIERQLDKQRTLTNEQLEELGKKKYGAVTIHLKKFVEQYSLLQNVELIHRGDIDQLVVGDFDDKAMQEIRNDISMLESSTLGLGAGAAAGAMTAFGAYSGTMLLASASTGTAISALSGVAATNATLAWLGGGSLAAGGMGMAGGMMVLGGVVAGPALAIFGSILSNSASEKLSNAKANYENAAAHESLCKSTIAKLEGIAAVSGLASSTLSQCRTACRRATTALSKVIEQSGTDYSRFSEDEKNTVFKAVKMAQLVKALVDTAILDEEGNLLGDSKANLRKVSEALA